MRLPVSIAILLAVGCSGKFVGSPGGRVVTPPEPCMESLAELSPSCAFIKALVQFSRVEPDGRNRKIMGVVYARPPDKYRIDLLGRLGGTAMEVRFFADSVAVYLPQESAQAVGEISQLGLLEELGLPGTKSLDLSLWLFGRTSRGWLESMSLRSRERTGSGCLLVFGAADGTRHEIRFNPEQRRVYHYSLSWPGGSAAARYSNFRQLLGISQPFRVEIEGFGGGKFRIDYRQVVERDEADDDLFKPRSGPDIHRVGIEAVEWGGNES